MTLDLINTFIFGATAVVTLITPIMLAVINNAENRRSKAHLVEAAKTATKVDEVRQDLQTQSSILENRLETIHVAVNSERQAMMERLERMHQEILRLTTANTKLEDVAK